MGETLSSTTTKPFFNFFCFSWVLQAHIFLCIHISKAGYCCEISNLVGHAWCSLPLLPPTHILHSFICGPWCSQLLPHLLALLIWYGGYVSTISTTSFCHLPSFLWHSSGPHWHEIHHSHMGSIVGIPNWDVLLIGSLVSPKNLWFEMRPQKCIAWFPFGLLFASLLLLDLHSFPWDGWH